MTVVRGALQRAMGIGLILVLVGCGGEGRGVDAGASASPRAAFVQDMGRAAASGARMGRLSAAITTASAARAMAAPAAALAATMTATTTTAAEAAADAEQLMDFAEKSYGEYFAGHEITQAYGVYLYRYYAATGVYLGVSDGNVYVLGGAFGPDIVLVGPLTRYITPVRPDPKPQGLCITEGLSYGVHATPSPAMGKNATATIVGCAGPIGDPTWTQTAGPAVTLQSARTQTISFDPPTPGTYAFAVSFVDPDGTMRSESVSLAVPAVDAPAAFLTLRASQSVRMGGKVSVRAWPTLPPDDTQQAITWTQIEGPAVTLDTSDPKVAFFTAPAVTRDTLVRLRATLQTTQGHTDSDEVTVLVEKYQQAPNANYDYLWSGDHVSRVHAYKAGGRYASVLQRCSYDANTRVQEGDQSLCPLSVLPFLAQDSGGAIPSVEQVMDHVLVSHDWLGRNFEQFLRTRDTRGDVRRMLMSVTAIVLGTGVRPSFYTPGTAAIYLDGDSFWLTPEERDTVNESPDYRAAFDSNLQYGVLWRYVKDNQSIFRYFDPERRASRNIDDVASDAFPLLFHELGHALDYVPPSVYGGFYNHLNPWQNIAPRYSAYLMPSDTLAAEFPLRSTTMAGLAGVKYRGASATPEQRALTPTQVGTHFMNDVATDDYNYTAPTEDLAMLVEEVLMAKRYGARRDVAFTDKYGSGATSSSIIVRWGQRGRVGEASIGPRARRMTQLLTPWLPQGDADWVAAPTALTPGLSWYANLGPSSAARQAQALDAQTLKARQWQFRQELRTMHRGRHVGSDRSAGRSPNRVPSHLRN